MTDILIARRPVDGCGKDDQSEKDLYGRARCEPEPCVCGFPLCGWGQLLFATTTRYMTYHLVPSLNSGIELTNS